jgi:hypothetical protein
MTPARLLVLWTIEQGGCVSRDAYRAKGIELGLPAPGQNGIFGTRRPLMVRHGELRFVTDYGRARAAAW